MYRCILFFSVALILLNTSCKSTEKITRANKQSVGEVLSGMNNANRSYHWFSAKAKIKFEGEELRVGGRSNIRMISDSLIWMNFKKVSIEGSRALMTRDSFWIVYRFDDLYESGSFDELMDYYKISLSFDELQKMIMGNVYVPAEDEVISLSTRKLHILEFQHNNSRYQYGIDGDYRLRELLIEDSFGRLVLMSISNYDETGFARSKDCRVLLENGSKSEVSIDLVDIEFDKPKTIKFEVPKHYIKLP